jgi:hypothetical protein
VVLKGQLSFSVSFCFLSWVQTIPEIVLQDTSSFKYSQFLATTGKKSNVLLGNVTLSQATFFLRILVNSERLGTVKLA